MSKVSAIISTYNSERFIRECLDDLLAQSLYREGGLEIVCVVSGSEQQEAEIVSEYAARHPHIVSTITPRETMYQAWNRGIALSTGEYLTNANTDDRHSPVAFERLSKHLDANTTVALAYANCYLSTVPNETFAQNTKARWYRYPKFFGPSAVLFYQLTPQPMWRRTVHERIGFFSNELRTAGDYDFNLRFALEFKAERVGTEPLGLYLAHTEALSFKDDTLKRETDSLREKYRHVELIERLYARAGAPIATAEHRAAVHTDMGLRAIRYFPPWFEGNPHQEPDFAKICFERALACVPSSPVAMNNLMVSCVCFGEPQRGAEIAKLLVSLPGPMDIKQNAEKCLAAIASPGQTVNLGYAPSGLPFPPEEELSQ